MTRLRPAWVEIDLAALAHNVAEVRRLCGGATLFAVCKGDAYGCGAERTAPVMRAAGVDGFAVADAEDARRIRAAGVDSPILLYGGTTPDLLDAALMPGVIATVHDAAGMEALAALGRPVEAYVEVDCGFGRLGFTPEEWPGAFARLAASNQVRVSGLYTHFSDPGDAAVTARQSALFARAQGDAAEAGLAGLVSMTASSRVLLGYPDQVLDAVNPGRMLYGMLEAPWDAEGNFRPVLSAVKSRVIQVRDLPEDFGVGYGGTRRAGRMRTAVIAFGFKDGIPRAPAGGEVLIRGRRVPVLGLRSTEHTVLDVTDVPDAAVGDEVVLLGRQEDAAIEGIEVCTMYKTEMIELLPRLGRSLPRVYI